VHVANIFTRRQYFDVGDTGNGMRRPDRDEKTVWSRVGFEEDIRAADVRARPRLQRGQDQQHCDHSAPASHLRTFCMARPACMPSHAMNHAISVAMAMPRQNISGVVSR